jgi:hypothetical protein
VSENGACLPPWGRRQSGWRMSNRRHLYIPDDLWSRLTSEAGTVGVRERGRAYSASEYACKLLAESLTVREFNPGHSAVCASWNVGGRCDCGGMVYEQSTRTDAQPTGQGGSASEPLPSAPLVPSDRAAGKPPTRAKGAPHADPSREDLGECAKCSNRATREHYPYCSKKCAT